ncbi:MAG: rRNA maturation RNase YbeY [Deltaproteobacteria bacterium]|nr:rRNA maturation RNase YbeY [Deltaproteobacteria bacterium]
MKQAKTVINITDIQRKFKINQRLVRYIVKNSINRLYCGSYEINIIFCSENYIKKLNKTYRNQNRATDVLSFEIKEWENGVYHLGEIYISPSVAQKNYYNNRNFWEKSEWISQNNDKESNPLYYYRKGFRREIALLVIHGILHLFGYVHDEEHKMNLDDEDYDKDMKNMQNFLYKELNGKL